jgi:hypothetical protein
MTDRLDKITIPATSLIKKGVIFEIKKAAEEKRKTDKKLEREFQKAIRGRR